MRLHFSAWDILAVLKWGATLTFGENNVFTRFVGAVLTHWGRVNYAIFGWDNGLGDNPLSEPMIVRCQLDPREHISMTFYLRFKGFHSRKCIGTCRLQKWRPSCLGLNVLINVYRLLLTPVSVPSLIPQMRVPDDNKPFPDDNVDLWSARLGDIHMRVISGAMLQPSITKMSLTIT